MKKLLTVASIDVFEHDDSSLTFTAGAMIDADGSGPETPGDTFIGDTTLHFQGKALNAQEVPFIVVPPQLRLKPSGIVMGCQARIVNTINGKACDCVVADVGPARKLGEISVAAAKAIGIPSSPLTGGTEKKIVDYTIWPGRAANVLGKTYKLQPA